MKFKILKGTPTFNALVALRDRMIAANKQAAGLVTEFGGKRYIPASGVYDIAGGISAIEMDEKPNGWRRVRAGNSDNAFFPIENRKENKTILDQIKLLPVISTQELNNIVGFEDQSIPNGKGGYTWYTRPSIHWNLDGLFLIEVNEECKFTPNADMIEITVSEFRNLSKKPEPQTA